LRRGFWNDSVTEKRENDSGRKYVFAVEAANEADSTSRSGGLRQSDVSTRKQRKIKKVDLID
jgi:hypothetical protein